VAASRGRTGEGAGIGAIEKRRGFGPWRQLSRPDRKSWPPRSRGVRAQAGVFRSRPQVGSSNNGKGRPLAARRSFSMTLYRAHLENARISLLWGGGGRVAGDVARMVEAVQCH